jgi:uncharacterized protein (TIGR02001 family)
VKKLFIATMLMVSANAYAETSATVTAASNYIWRGLSFSTNGATTVASQGQAVVQGSFDYSHSSGFAASLFAGAADTTRLIDGSANGATVERDNEFDPTLSYTYAITEDLKVIGAVTRYSYMKNSDNNSTDIQLAFAWRAFRLDGSFMDKYFGAESTDTYVRLSMREPITEKVTFIAAVGNSSFEKEEKVGFKSYTDWRAGLAYNVGSTVVEAAFTDTNRKDLADVEQKDEAVTMSIAMTFQ